MKLPIFAAALLIGTSGFAIAQEAAPSAPDNAGAIPTEPAPKAGGTTANPTAKPDTSGLADKNESIRPNTEGGTASPTAEPETGKLQKDPPKTP